MDYFRNSYEYRWSNTQGIDFLRYHNIALDVVVSFPTPILSCFGCYGGDWVELFEMNVITRIYRTKTIKKEQLGSGMYRYEDDGARELYTTFYSGPTSIPDANNEVYYASGGSARLRTIRYESKTEQESGATSFYDYFSTSGILAQVQGNNSKTITFTMPRLTDEEIEHGVGYKYEIECVANPITQNSMFGFYEATHNGWHTPPIPGFITVLPKYSWTIVGSGTVVDASSCKITSTLYHQDMTSLSEGGPLITKGVKYSAYQLLRKALLTCDTYILDNSTTSLDQYNSVGQKQPSIEFPILLDDTWNNRLQVAKINETIFEVNNLWELLIQIGYYLHAIPYLEFARDGTDRFVLKFKQLGGTKINNDESTKITVFNSRNLSEYFTQYDSYVTNLFSPQNLIEEWVVPKTSDSSYLVSNNTAELQLSYAITEIVEFHISMYVNGEWQTKSALNHIFEKSIYDVLSNDNPYQVFPAKGSALYYNLGDSKIQGLNFVPPSVNGGEVPMALKRIVQILWQGTEIEDVAILKFNNLKFHIKYRTQDTARINQFRPDIQSFMKNSSYEKYPHHEQFYNQQGKIIDSERYTANLYGKLIRVGNGVYQRQEYVKIPGTEKESGDLVMIDNEPYYVMVCENEEYPDAIFQKVTYSKNFNQLSNIVTIPSEPRFYEVSERSKIRREVRVMDFFSLCTEKNTEAKAPVFLNNSKWKEFLRNLIFNENSQDLPNYAWTRFRVDRMREHNYDNDKMFPSSLLDRSGVNVVPCSPSDHSDVIVPLLHFPLHDGIVFTWSMLDNFKAGDFIDDHVYTETTETDDAYLSMQPMRYVDTYGRADLFSFKLFNKTDWSHSEAQKLPRAVVNPDKADCIVAVQGNDTTYIALDKDCREEISINYHINLLHNVPDGDDDFITFPNLFGIKEGSGKLKVALLSDIQSMFNENQNITNADILADSEKGEIDYQLINDDMNAIEIRFNLSADIDLAKVKSIVLYEGELAIGKFAYIIKNVHKLADEDKLQSWWIYPVYTD